MTNNTLCGIIWTLIKIITKGVNQVAEKIPVKGNDGFFLQVDKIFLDLLHCTDLNIYGILILAQVYEFKRNKKPCILSTQSFCDLFKTSHYTIENQLKILCDLNLIHKAIKTNQKNTISRVRHLTIPQNFAKTMERLLKNMPDKQAQNFEVPSTQKTGSKRKNLSDLQPTNLGVAYPSEASSNFDDKQPTNSHQSNPQNLRNNNIIDEPNINNKLLEDINMSSPASSTDDFWNATDFENVSIPDVIDDANFDLILGNNNLDNNNLDLENNTEMKNPNKKKPYPNHIYDEATVWYYTQLNPIERYNYEIKQKSAAMNFAWVDREKEKNQKDYYTVEQILEYFTAENQLTYLEKIGWINKHRDYLEQINWEHLWMFPKN